MGANLEQSMHKSKLGGLIIGCRTDDLEAGRAGFRRAGEHAEMGASVAVASQE
jgi:hypothetical protein